MSDILQRVWNPLTDLEIRGDGRTVYGLAVPYDTPTRIVEHGKQFDEVFRMGSFSETIQERGDRVKFLLNHDRRTMPLGKAMALREDPAGLVGEFRVSDTEAGREALELIRDGVLDSLSVGFVPQQSRGTPGLDDVVERLAVKLMEVSAVAFPAYEGAAIAGVRHQIVGTDHPDSAPDQGEPVTPDQGEAPDQRNRQRKIVLLDTDQRLRRVLL